MLTEMCFFFVHLAGEKVLVLVTNTLGSFSFFPNWFWSFFALTGHFYSFFFALSLSLSFFSPLLLSLSFSSSHSHIMAIISGPKFLGSKIKLNTQAQAQERVSEPIINVSNSTHQHRKLLRKLIQEAFELVGP